MTARGRQAFAGTVDQGVFPRTARTDDQEEKTSVHGGLQASSRPMSTAAAACVILLVEM